jgi:XTP/dITP diphosphohydrolase
MTEILVATRNFHKTSEIQAILGRDFRIGDLKQFPNAPEVIEDAPDFAGNAIKKAVTLAEWIAGQPRRPDYIMADDSGLEVDALNGKPGVHSARFAALDTGSVGNTSDAENNAKLLRLMKGIEKRSARFKCVIALVPVLNSTEENASPVCYANPAEMLAETFEGVCEGRILEAPQGSHGFGYDPLFVPEGYIETFGELTELQKNEISHRAKAVAKLKAFLEKNAS